MMDDRDPWRAEDSEEAVQGRRGKWPREGRSRSHSAGPACRGPTTAARCVGGRAQVDSDPRRRLRPPRRSLEPASFLASHTLTGRHRPAPSSPVNTPCRNRSPRVDRLPSMPPTSACASSVGSRRASGSLPDTPSTSKGRTLPLGGVSSSRPRPSPALILAQHRHLSQCQGCL